MTMCDYCGQTIPADSPLNLGKKIENVQPWYKWANFPAGHLVTVPGVGTVQKVLSFVHEGERNFGGDIEARILLAVEGELYMKVGTTDSYGETVWDKAFTKVNMVTTKNTEYRDADGRKLGFKVTLRTSNRSRLP